VVIFQKLISELKNILTILKSLSVQILNTANAVRCAKTYKIKTLTVKELLKDREIEIILNLTIPKAHYQVAKLSFDKWKTCLL
jgi:hypothetical protein